MTGQDDLAEVVRRERQLLDPAARADREAVAGLLHPDFIEFGASGRVWNRETTIATLAADPQIFGSGSDFEGVRLADDVVLLTYRFRGDVGSLRSSVWVRDAAAGWRLRFHQGTRAPSTAESSPPG